MQNKDKRTNLPEKLDQVLLLRGNRRLDHLAKQLFKAVLVLSKKHPINKEKHRELISSFYMSGLTKMKSSKNKQDFIKEQLLIEDQATKIKENIEKEVVIFNIGELIKKETQKASNRLTIFMRNQLVDSSITKQHVLPSLITTALCFDWYRKAFAKVKNIKSYDKLLKIYHELGSNSKNGLVLKEFIKFEEESKNKLTKFMQSDLYKISLSDRDGLNAISNEFLSKDYSMKRKKYFRWLDDFIVNGDSNAQNLASGGGGKPAVRRNRTKRMHNDMWSGKIKPPKTPDFL